MTNWVTTSTYTKETAQFREGIKRWYKKPLPTCPMTSDSLSAGQPSMPLRLSDTIMQVQFSSFSIWMPISITSWKWIPAFKSSIPYQKWSQGMTSSNGSLWWQAASLCLRNRVKYRKRAMPSNVEFTQKTLSTTFCPAAALWTSSGNPKNHKESEYKQESDRMTLFQHSMILW